MKMIILLIILMSRLYWAGRTCAGAKVTLTCLSNWPKPIKWSNNIKWKTVLATSIVFTIFLHSCVCFVTTMLAWSETPTYGWTNLEMCVSQQWYSNSFFSNLHFFLYFFPPLPPFFLRPPLFYYPNLNNQLNEPPSLSVWVWCEGSLSLSPFQPFLCFYLLFSIVGKQVIFLFTMSLPALSLFLSPFLYHGETSYFFIYNVTPEQKVPIPMEVRKK
jgi:hypothetical protein